MPEAFCPTCGKATLAVKEAVYEGFTRIGERLKCAVCGHVFDAPEDLPAPPKKTPAIFTDDDRSPVLKVFREGENSALCRYCTHYTVNPFRQWCGLQRREVEATDTCDQFAAKEIVPPPI